MYIYCGDKDTQWSSVCFLAASRMLIWSYVLKKTELCCEIFFALPKTMQHHYAIIITMCQAKCFLQSPDSFSRLFTVGFGNSRQKKLTTSNILKKFQKTMQQCKYQNPPSETF